MWKCTVYCQHIITRLLQLYDMMPLWTKYHIISNCGVHEFIIFCLWCVCFAAKQMSIKHFSRRWRAVALRKMLQHHSSMLSISSHPRDRQNCGRTAGSCIPSDPLHYLTTSLQHSFSLHNTSYTLLRVSVFTALYSFMSLTQPMQFILIFPFGHMNRA